MHRTQVEILVQYPGTSGNPCPWHVVVWSRHRMTTSLQCGNSRVTCFICPTICGFMYWNFNKLLQGILTITLREWPFVNKRSVKRNCWESDSSCYSKTRRWGSMSFLIKLHHKDLVFSTTSHGLIRVLRLNVVSVRGPKHQLIDYRSEKKKQLLPTCNIVNISMINLVKFKLKRIVIEYT